jgi:hypothetical protein
MFLTQNLLFDLMRHRRRLYLAHRTGFDKFLSSWFNILLDRGYEDFRLDRIGNEAFRVRHVVHVIDFVERRKATSTTPTDTRVDFAIEQFIERELEGCDRRPSGRQMESTVKILVLPAELSGIDEIFLPSHFFSKFIHVGAHLVWPLRNGFFRAAAARGTQISGKQILTQHSTIARDYD